jgi:hypothetical protein
MTHLKIDNKLSWIGIANPVKVENKKIWKTELAL